MDDLYPVSLEVDYVARRSRLTTFFRLLLVIPWAIFAALVGIGVVVVTLIAWFAILFTGRYPAGMYRFSTGALRSTTRINAFQWLLTDAWPSFDLAEHPEYPVRTVFAPQPERQSRLTTFFRGVLIIPVIVVLYVFNLIAQIVLLVSWLAIVFGGSQPKGIQEFVVGYEGYVLRSSAYYLLLRDEYPPLFRWGSSNSVREGSETAVA